MVQLVDLLSKSALLTVGSAQVHHVFMRLAPEYSISPISDHRWKFVGQSDDQRDSIWSSGWAKDVDHLAFNITRNETSVMTCTLARGDLPPNTVGSAALHMDFDKSRIKLIYNQVPIGMTDIWRAEQTYKFSELPRLGTETGVESAGRGEPKVALTCDLTSSQESGKSEL